jgi:AraC family transcriptional regulator
MNAAIDYIETNLTGDIDMSIAASKACCSEYHFTRFFSFITDMSLSEYIRCRRLTLAGFMLQESAVKVIEIANMFGYNSPNSFTRAFQAMHGVTPSDARRLNIELKALERRYFTLGEKAQAALDFQIVTEGDHRVFGSSFITKRNDAYETVPAFWVKCNEKGITHNIVKAGCGNEKTLLSTIIDDVNDDSMMRYMICLDVPEGGVPDAYETAVVPARTWVVFPLVIEKPGDTIISVWKRIHREWFPNSGYEQDTGPRQERCYWREDGKMVVEAWVPVIKIRGA